jgi:hypothetical protein
MAGEPDPSFPRDLRQPISRGLPLSIVVLPRLRVVTMLRWLEQQGISAVLRLPDRALCACLVARFGYGFIFVDADISVDEARFSVAHEVAHFLRDYWWPRRRAAETLGEQILTVFDGLRSATSAERIHGLLREVQVGFHVHLMERDSHSGLPSAETDDAEQNADRLAYELLAPACVVAARTTNYETADRLLRHVCGLPPAQASAYAALLFPPPTPPDALFVRLFSTGASHFEPSGGK